jgi:hypothetical protein
VVRFPNAYMNLPPSIRHKNTVLKYLSHVSETEKVMSHDCTTHRNERKVKEDEEGKSHGNRVTQRLRYVQLYPFTIYSTFLHVNQIQVQNSEL